ncbi:MAG: DUF4340 domain-containing protein [Polyangiaceae bacterium]|jgi:hypothetical protein
MSRDKLIIFGVVLLGLLGVLVYKQTKVDEAIGAPLAVATDLPTVSAPDDVDKISITNGDKAEVVLERVPDSKAAPVDGGTAGVWRLSKPISAEANQQTVKDLVANLKDLKAESQVSLKLDDDVRKDKQLDPAHAVHVVAWKGADKKLDELFGKSGTAGELTVITDKPNAVWAVKGYSAYLYTKEPKDFRDKEVLKFDDANASQVTIANSHGTLSFTKGDKWAGTFDQKPILRFDEEKVKDMLRAYKALMADDFGDNKQLSDTGLDKPAGTVTIHLKDDAKTFQLLVGNVSSGTNHWAKRSDGDVIYQIGSSAAEWALSDDSKYRSTPDGGAGDGGKPPPAKPAKK